MKIENTPKNRSKFNALYYGQRVFCSNPENRKKLFKMINPVIQFGYLELTPLSQITDEDAIEVAKITYPGNENWSKRQHTSDKGIQLIDSTFNSDEDSFSVFGLNDPMGKLMLMIDFLRSRGYYVGDGTEIEYGWVKLRE